MPFRLLFIPLLAFATSLTAQSDYFPPTDASGVWQTTSPTELNWCQDSIDALYTFLEAEQTKSFLLLKDGKIVLENYFGTYRQDSIYPWFSAGKSLRAVLVGIAAAEGNLSIEAPVSTYLGEGWTSLTPAQEDSVNVSNLLTMTSGLNELFFFCDQPECRTYRAPAGERWAYHNSPYALTKEVLETATGESMNSFTNTRIKQKTGMGTGFWLDFAPSQTFYFSKARDLARFGLLVQRNGRWSNDEVVYPENDYFTAMLLPTQSMNPAYGYLWWLNGQESYIGPDSPVSVPGTFSSAGPADLVVAAGANGQFISVSRETGLIMIRQGSSGDESLAPVQLHNLIWERINRLECEPNSTENSVEQSHLSIYPNPAKNWFRISNRQPEDEVAIYDLAGRIIRQLPDHRFNYVGDLPRGQYLVTVSNQAGKRSVKLILN